jgi:hypothetical protein
MFTKKLIQAIVQQIDMKISSLTITIILRNWLSIQNRCN